MLIIEQKFETCDGLSDILLLTKKNVLRITDINQHKIRIKFTTGQQVCVTFNKTVDGSYLIHADDLMAKTVIEKELPHTLKCSQIHHFE
jgi:hypothetical protein